MATLGSMLLNKDVDSIIKMNEMCNEYGLDTISAGSVLAWAMECYEKGIFTKDDLDGIELKWGDGEAAVNLLRKICKNKGIGQILKLGSKAAADKLGKGHECLVVCGGIEEPQHDARFIVGLGSTYMADPTPGRHVKASLPLTSQDADFDPEISLQGLGLENILSIVDCEIMNCCGACAFGFGDGNKNDAIIKNIMAVTGNEYSRADIIRLGVRIFTMRQLFNAREGIGRAELSERVYKGKPPFKGTLADLDLDFNKVVDELYDALGWSRGGVPSNGALKTLGLGYLNKDERGAENERGKKSANSPSYFTSRGEQTKQESVN
jgi:aldehyde:ferredoxin oxidoreductase